MPTILNNFGKGALLLATVFSLFSCNNSAKKENHENVKQLLPQTITEVTVEKLTNKLFTQQLVSNGKIVARRHADLRFLQAERIEQVMVQNGDVVKTGQPIARIADFTLKNQLSQAKDDLERSKLELQDLIIGLGYKLKDSTLVSKDMMQLIKVKSGYNKAKNQYKIAKFNLEKSVLYAPISGTISNLKNSANNYAKPSDTFCNVVDMSSLEVAFSVLENEMQFLNKGDKVTVVPYALPNLKLQGIISEINPWVDENGLIKAKAKVKYHAKIMEGMNVKVNIYRSYGKKLMVPKSAVVLRTGKQVVFSIKNDTLAYWNYITTELENGSSYTITSKTLREGDMVIVTGNVNLANESPVKVVRK